MRNTLKLLRNIFLVLFIAATLIAFAILYRDVLSPLLSEPPIPVEPGTDYGIVKLENITTLIASVIASLTALLGFVITATLNVRKDRREEHESRLTIQQKELELERTRMELEELKRKAAQKS